MAKNNKPEKPDSGTSKEKPDKPSPSPKPEKPERNFTPREKKSTEGNAGSGVRG